MARALACIQGSAFVLPDHVQAVVPAVLRHRLVLTPQARLAGMDANQVIESILSRVEVPIYAGA
jgi:MoxR-like ATPase